MPTTRTRGPYAKTAARRRTIVEAGAAVFAERGFRATTMKDVAERANISESGLTHHFGSKDDLLSAVLQHHERRAGAGLDLLSGPESLEAMVGIVQRDRPNAELVELHTTLSAEATAADHPAHEHYRRRYASSRTYVQRAFTALHDQGDLETTLTPSELASAYLALSDGLQLQWLYDRDAVDAPSVLRRFLQSVIPSTRQTEAIGEH